MRLSAFHIRLALFAVVPLAAFAGSPRRLLSAPPILQGREVERFILTAAVQEGGIFILQAGQLVAVAEDDDGVFFQASRNLLIGLTSYRPERVPGGLHVSKRNPTVMTVYFGDARNPKDVMRIINKRLTFEQMRALMVAKAAK